MRMMIVDDSMVIRNRIARLMTDSRFSNLEIVGLACNGVQALEIGRSKKPEVVTMDLTMPHMDGDECIGELVRLLPDTRILVVSALSDKTTALRAVKRGAHGFLHKPFRDEELVQSLLELMQ